MRENHCKICRRVGTKLFLKGERCLSAKCPMIRRPYPPGPQSKKRRKTFSEYGKQLREKQKLRNWYGLREHQFKAYVRGVLQKRARVEDAQSLLIKKLEKRLDNAVFKLGFASSREQARQLVGHGHFLVNGRKVNIPSFQLEKGDVVKLSTGSQGKTNFQNVQILLKNRQIPSWLNLDIKNFEGKVVGDPSFEEASLPVEISSIFEFYSR